MSHTKVPLAIVMPCRNEEHSLRSACESLGFGLGESLDVRDQCLIIVDNGSSDGSALVSQEICLQSPPGRVLVVHEPERGHVPARARGVRAAMEHFGAEFVLQVDADTLYSPRYAAALFASAVKHGHGTLIEARMAWPNGFALANPVLMEALERSEEDMDNSMAFPDVVVDDKACGYWLKDYELWGGHRQEFWSSGEEMLAETTRLFIRGHQHGARRQLVDDVAAQHSVRNWIRNAELECASAGFPMPSSWQSRWMHSEGQVVVHSDLGNCITTSALTMRRKILKALFARLPRLVQTTTLRKVEVGVGISETQELVRTNCSSIRPAFIIESAMRASGVLD